MPKNKNEKKKTNPTSVKESGYGFPVNQNGEKKKKDKKGGASVTKNADVGGFENEKENSKESSIRYYLKITGVLTAVCAVVALMLGLVNFLTEDTIASREETARREAVYEIFPDVDEVLTVDGDDSLFAVCKNGAIDGYCVSVTTPGYAGDISLMVGVTPEKKVKAVKILSMSETAGLGSKTQSPLFLNAFVGKSAPLTVGDNVDAISGATVSSKAVTKGVETALEYPVDIEVLSKKLGLVTDEESTAEETVTDTEKEEAEVQPVTQETAQYNGNTVYREDTHIDPASVGAVQNYRYYSSDSSYTATNQNIGNYVEKETTDTDTDTADT